MSSNHLFCRSMPNSSSLVVKLRPPSMLSLPPSFLLPCRPRRSQSRTSRGETPSCSRSFASADQLRTSFVNALVRAGHDGSCSEKEKRRRRRRTEEGTQQRMSSTVLAAKSENRGASGRIRPELGTLYTREDVLGLVDQYDEWPGAEKQQLNGGESGEDTWDKHLSWSEGQAKRPSVDEDDEDRLDTVLGRLYTLLTDEGSEPEEVFKTYKRLPEPGAKFLDKGMRIYLIRKLSVIEKKSPARTLAFLSVLDDYRAAKLPIPRHAWNSAIHLGSTTLTKFTDTEVEFALKTWKEMEIQAGVKGNVVTFNILFNAASKAGKVALAEMIVQEMDARRLSWTRFTRVGAILYYGLRGQGEAVRKQYRDLVSSGEVVDVVVLNCVISALMSAAEHDAGFAVYTRMRTLSKEREGTSYAPRLWSKQREIGQNLVWIAEQMREARQSGDRSRIRQTERMLAGMQDMISIAPNERTCDILMRHYCALGEFQKVVRVLEDMQELGFAYREKTFTFLFRAFAEHGLVRYPTWTASRFASIWEAFETLLLDSEAEEASQEKTQSRGWGRDRSQDRDDTQGSKRNKNRDRKQGALTKQDVSRLQLNDSSRITGIWALIAARRLESHGGPSASHVYGVLCRAWTGEMPAEEAFLNPDDAGSAQVEDEGIEWLDEKEEIGDAHKARDEAEDEDWDDDGEARSHERESEDLVRKQEQSVRARRVRQS